MIWKYIGIICSGLWLIVAGYIASLFYLAVMLAAGSQHPPVRDQTANVWGVILAYLLLGIGPVVGFIFAMIQQRRPLGYIALISLAICAAYPFIWVIDLFIS